MITEDSPVHKIKWRRIIVSSPPLLRGTPPASYKSLSLQLDEAHNIKERATNTAKACFELKSDVKWCLSGTPLQNRVGECKMFLQEGWFHRLITFQYTALFDSWEGIRSLSTFVRSFFFVFRVSGTYHRFIGKACDCKSLHWQFVDHKYCKGWCMFNLFS